MKFEFKGQFVSVTAESQIENMALMSLQADGAQIISAYTPPPKVEVPGDRGLLSTEEKGRRISEGKKEAQKIRISKEKRSISGKARMEALRRDNPAEFYRRVHRMHLGRENYLRNKREKQLQHA